MEAYISPTLIQWLNRTQLATSNCVSIVSGLTMNPERRGDGLVMETIPRPGVTLSCSQLLTQRVKRRMHCTEQPMCYICTYTSVHVGILIPLL